MAIQTEFLSSIQVLKKLLATASNLSTEYIIEAQKQIDTTDWTAYATIQHVTSTPSGTVIKYDGDSETEYAETQYISLYSVNFIGNNSIAMARRAVPIFQLNSVVQQLISEKIGILSISAVRNLSVAIDGGHEERAQFDLTISEISIVKDELNVVNSVEINTDYEV